jgi:hypothetical protein
MESESIQDNQVLKYLVDFEKKEITLSTKSEAQELTDIVFSGVVAYLFEDTIIGCIIMDIEEWPVEDLISCLGEDYLTKHKNYGWPFDFQDISDFKNKVKENGITIYNLASSYGMSGFILSKSVKYTPRKS